MRNIQTIYYDKRESGIPLIGEIPWGTSFCQFFQNHQELIDILVPFFKAGLKNNEACIWVTSKDLGPEEAAQALGESLPNFQELLKKGQIEIISYDQWQNERRKSGEGLVSRIDNAIASGFESLRLAFNVYPGKKSSRSAVSSMDINIINQHNVIAFFAYPRDEFDAVGLMEVVKQHRCALIRNADQWEIIESSEAQVTREALKRSEQLYRSLFDNMLDGYAYCRMIFKDGQPEDFIYLAVNSAFEKLTGLKDVVGKKVTDIIPGIKQSNPELFDIYSHSALTGQSQRFETYLKPLKIWLSISVFSPEKGTFIAVFENITERKQAEETLKINNERLQQRTQELETLNQELESFSYTVSHDLRAPLRSIDGFSQALLEDYANKLDEQGKEFLKTIRTSSQLMSQLIDDILGLSRVIRTEIRHQQVNLSELAIKISEDLKRTQPDRQVEWILQPDIQAYGDINLLRIALENLIGNAFKYTSKCKTARIEFGILEGNESLLYFIRDNGAGFDMAYVDDLFQPFHRLHGAKEFPGNGIGLATVKRIIQRHGGKVWAEGEVDKGATLYFTLRPETA